MKDKKKNAPDQGTPKTTNDTIQLPAGFESHFDPATRAKIQEYLLGTKPAAA